MKKPVKKTTKKKTVKRTVRKKVVVNEQMTMALHPDILKDLYRAIRRMGRVKYDQVIRSIARSFGLIMDRNVIYAVYASPTLAKLSTMYP